MKKTLVEMVQGIRGEISSKRVITFISFLCVVFAFVYDVLFEVDLDENTFDSMMYLVVSGMGLTVFEKFSPSHAHKPLKERTTEVAITPELTLDQPLDEE